MGGGQDQSREEGEGGAGGGEDSTQRRDHVGSCGLLQAPLGKSPWG